MAIDAPDLSALQSHLPGRPTRHFHITLKFLGEVEEDRLPALVSALQRIPFSPFEVVLGGLSAFPSLRRPRVIHVTCAASQSLVRLADAVHEATPELSRDKAFRPHITLSRLRRPAQLGTLPQPQLPTFKVDQFVLYRSQLSSQGASYQALERFPAS